MDIMLVRLRKQRREDSRYPGARPSGHRCAMFAPGVPASAVERVASAKVAVLKPSATAK